MNNILLEETIYVSVLQGKDQYTYSMLFIQPLYILAVVCVCVCMCVCVCCYSANALLGQPSTFPQSVYVTESLVQLHSCVCVCVCKLFVAEQSLVL